MNGVATPNGDGLADAAVVERAFSAFRGVLELGYAPFGDDGWMETDVGPDDVSIVCDIGRWSMMAPHGTAVRHYGFHVGLRRDGRFQSVAVGRSNAAQTAHAQLESPGGLEDVACELAHSLTAILGREWTAEYVAGRLRRALDQYPGNPQGLTPPERLHEERIDLAFEALRRVHVHFGSWRYHGRPDATHPAGFSGPVFWEEGDVQFRLAVELEREFPLAVHFDGLLGRAVSANWDAELDGGNQKIDIVVVDLRDFIEGPDALARRQNVVNDLLCEVKYIHKDNWASNVRNAISGTISDVDRLGRHLTMGRTRAARMLLVDDQLAFLRYRNTMPWLGDVVLEHVTPPEPRLDPGAPAALPFPFGIDTESQHDALAWTPTERDNHPAYA